MALRPASHGSQPLSRRIGPRHVVLYLSQDLEDEMQTTEQPKTSRYLQANSPIQVPSAGVSKAIPWNVRPRQRWAFLLLA